MCHCSGKTQIINPWPLGAIDGVLRCDGEAVPALLHLPIPSRPHLATAPQADEVVSTTPAISLAIIDCIS